MSIPKLSDALSLIQRTEKAIANNTDDAPYCEMITDLVGAFKKRLSQDHNLPVEAFDSVDPTLETTESISENPELTFDGANLYDQIETSIWCIL